MIPKKIHYIWFGKNPLPELVLKCIESWKKHCPDYEIKKWDEDNFDFSKNIYAKEAYDAKKWAFVSDYARVKILHDEGGIYLDTDMEILKNLDIFLENDFFAGFESKKFINAAILGSVKSHPLLKEMLNSYKNDKFILDNGLYNERTIVERLSKILKNNSFRLNNTLQKIDSVCIYSNDFFYPKNNFNGKINLNSNSHTIHHYDGSWLDTFQHINKQNRYILTSKYGKFIGISIYRLQIIAKCLSKNGFKKTLNLVKNRLKNPLW